LKTGHAGATATLLGSGLVLIAGGNGPSSGGPAIASAELYDPSTGTFTPTGSMKTARAHHTATLLPNRKVLVAGGSNGLNVLSSAELYDPDTGTFTPTGAMKAPRRSFTAVGVATNKVLIAGGWNGSKALASAELYDWTAGTFALTGSMAKARYGHTATMIDAVTTRVLIVGGDTGSNTVLASAEIYNPAAGTFALTGSMKTARAYHTATLLPGTHKVLIAGGGHPVDTGEIGWGQLASAELYDIGTGKFAATGALKQAREDHTATILGDGEVLIVGGHDWEPYGGMDPRSFLASAELYNPATGTFTPAGTLKQGRDAHTATLLEFGRVLIAGGGTEAIVSGSPATPALTSAEVWQL
jgi:hypothetical protein